MLLQDSIPEVVEETAGQALNERLTKLSLPGFTNTLGPQDLVTIVKRDVQKRSVGSFLYVAGLDSSDPTSVAVWLKEMVECIEAKPQLWFGKNTKFNVESISYTTWNVFRQCDMTVRVHLPGKIETTFIDKSGNIVEVENNEEADTLWIEAFVSGKMRDMMCMVENRDDGEVINVVETKIMNPLMSGQLDGVPHMFIKLFPMFFSRGPEVGSPCIYGNMPSTLTNNYLVETLCEIVRLTKNKKLCLQMLQELKQIHGSVVNILIARTLLNNNSELDGVRLVYETLKEIEDPIYKCELLHLQAKYLLAHSDPFFALVASQKAVELTPNSFVPWYYLVKCYIALGDYKRALLSMNSLPMSLASQVQKFQYSRVINTDASNAKAELHLPLPLDVVLDEVTNLNSTLVMEEHKTVNQELSGLKAANLNNIFQSIYDLLGEIVKNIGWEKLLQHRAELFLMEDEYDHLESADTNSAIASSHIPKGKRLCERWFDNLFMLLYDDLKINSQWQVNELKPHTTLEWELIGLSCFRLKQFRNAKAAFENALQKRFSSQSSRKLLQLLQIEKQTNPSETIDQQIIDLCVKLCCWNHRWYSEFSIILLDAMSPVVEAMGITRVDNEVNSRFPASVAQLFHENILSFYKKYANDYYDD